MYLVVHIIYPQHMPGNPQHIRIPCGLHVVDNIDMLWTTSTHVSQRKNRIASNDKSLDIQKNRWFRVLKIQRFLIQRS